jgi:hypothetical protein
MVMGMPVWDLCLGGLFVLESSGSLTAVDPAFCVYLEFQLLYHFRKTYKTVTERSVFLTIILPWNGVSL